MTFTEAAIAVLKAKGVPMTDRELVAEALARGLIVTRGRTPWATMSAALYDYTRDNPVALIKRVYQPGQQRAARGSVRWALHDGKRRGTR